MDIFEGKLYTLPVNRKPDSSDKELIEKIIKKDGLDISLEKMELIKVGEDYDLFFIKTSDNFYSFKFSFDGDNKALKREIKLVKKLKSKCVPTFVSGGSVVVGEKLLYLLCEANRSEPISDYGIGALASDFDKFLEDYSEFCNSPAHNYGFKSQTNNFVDSFDFSVLFNKEGINNIEANTDYLLCRTIVSTLCQDIKELCRNINFDFPHNIVGDFDTSYIYYDGLDFQFFDLKNSCRGHIFSDISNLSLTLGLSKDYEKHISQKACEVVGIEYDREIFSVLYQIELRKKTLKLFTNYLKEVYLYESQRTEEIFRISQEFSNSYETYCQIPIVKENRQFIFKNITQPILHGHIKK